MSTPASASIESVLQETRIFPPDAKMVAQANISGMDAYRALCAAAEKDYTGFWADLARKHLLWKKPFTQTFDDSKAPFFRWFADGTLNASYNCLDRHLQTQPDKIAVIFEADDGRITRASYRELHRQTCVMANGLKSRGIKKGDRVIIYMPMSIEAIVAMQACARIGAIHSVVFGGFSAKSLQERIIDAGAVAVLTADEQMRGGKAIALKTAVDDGIALGGCESIKSVVVYQRTGGKVNWNATIDVWLHDLVKGQSETCEPEWVDAEHPLFILYTSGSTGKPKGIQHSTGGYWDAEARADLVYQSRSYVRADNLQSFAPKTLLDLRLGASNDRFGVQFFVNNVLDDRTPIAAVRFFDSVNFSVASPLVQGPEGRQFGVTLRAGF